MDGQIISELHAQLKCLVAVEVYMYLHYFLMHIPSVCEFSKNSIVTYKGDSMMDLLLED